MRYAIINEQMIVINIIEWDGVSQWAPPQGCVLMESLYANRGDFYNKEDNTFSQPVLINIEAE